MPKRSVSANLDRRIEQNRAEADRLDHLLSIPNRTHLRMAKVEEPTRAQQKRRNR